jgi:hypothetical protein
MRPFEYRSATMIRAISIFLITMLAAGWSLHASASAGQPATPETVLLLRNGEVLRGPITKVGDRYVVVLGDGSELRIGVGDVEMHCVDLEEAYLRKRSSAKPRSVNDHLAMADWCLRNTLHQRAADELLAAIALDPKHPKIPWFERRLQMAVCTPQADAVGEAGSTCLVSLDELERTMRGLPAETMEVFVARVQPLLLNRCGANTCHGGRSEAEFRLVRPAWGKTITRRFTQRNLYAAVQMVDAGKPEESRLLLAPSGPHASLPGPVFNDHEEPQLRLLVEWVRQVADAREPNAIVSQANPEPLMQASYQEPVHLPDVGDPADSAADRRQRAPQASGVSPAALSDVPPRDPFDPAIFNRRFVKPESKPSQDSGSGPAP